jgi:broad specificity phosphatase PhoE
VVIVSHQLPIWMVHRSVVGAPLAHDPRHRRCALSSVTTFAIRQGRVVETGYEDPAGALLVGAVDQGAT